MTWSSGVESTSRASWAAGTSAIDIGVRADAILAVVSSLAVNAVETSRMKHIPVAWDRARLERLSAVETVEVPAGQLKVRHSRVVVEREPSQRTYSRGRVPNEGAQREWHFWIEVTSPHRVVKWTRDDSLTAELVASRRLQYWDLQRLEHESYLPSLGIDRMRSPRPPR